MRLLAAARHAQAALSLAALVCLLGGCRNEPVITIRFEPQDLAQPAPRVERTALASDAAPSSPTAKLAPLAALEKDTPRREGGGGSSKCSGDADCLKVKGDCCGCSQGGTAAAVARTDESAHQAKLARECGETTMCIQMLSNHPSCRLAAACRGGRCVLVEGSARARENPAR